MGRRVPVMDSRDSSDPKLTVYFDEAHDHAHKFIGSHEAKRLTKFLATGGFAILDANQLEVWMRDSVASEYADSTSVVFARDVIPEQIFGDVDGNVLFRQYLDAGGRITWLGDVPGWYKGKPGGKDEEVWALGSFVSILGIAPVMANCVAPVELSSKASQLGLKLPWYSMRPILVNEDRTSDHLAKSPLSQFPLEVLAWTDVTLGNSVVRIPKRWRSIRSVSLGGQLGLGAQVTIDRSESIRIYKKRCASAWHIVFNSAYPKQGFYRIWDHPVRLSDLSDARLQEVLSIATHSLPTP